MNPFSSLRIHWLIVLATCAPLHGQSSISPSSNLPPRPGSTTTPATTSTRLPGGLTTTANNPPPSREIKVVEKKLEELSNRDFSEHATKALSILPQKWKHAETENFILHYRRVTEANKVAREVEYQLWYVASFLGATKERYTTKSHVFIFEDDDEWKTFLMNGAASTWAKSFAHGDDLFLNVRGGGNTGSGSFDFVTLAHETTHAVVARLFPGKRWPLWMNEGFAEHMAYTSIGARKGSVRKQLQPVGSLRYLPGQLEATTAYPTDPVQVQALYRSSHDLMSFLVSELPKDRFLKLLDAMLGGKTLKDSVLEIYPDKFKSWEDFNKRYERYLK